MHAYGSFNPNFYGVSQALNTPEAFVLLKEYAAAADVSDWHDAQEDHDLARLAAVSAIDHEVRHFHDFLLSPWAMQTMVFRLQATINGQTAIKALANASGDFIPVPLTRWMGWDAERRDEWLKLDGAAAGIQSASQLVSFPTVDFDTPMGRVASALEEDEVNAQITMIAEACARSYFSMEKFRAPIDTPIDLKVSSTGLYEATAHIVQGAAIYRGQGEAAYRSFMAEISRNKQDYLVPLNLVMFILSEHGIVPHAKRLLQLFTWTLITPPGLPAEVAHPANRFYVMLQLLRAGPEALMSQNESSTAAVWDALDQAANLPAWNDILGAAQEYFDARVEIIKQTFTGNGSVADSLLPLVDRWQQDVRMICDQIINNADAYCDPVTYLDNWSNRLPAPLYMVHFGGNAHSLQGPMESDRTRLITAPYDKNLVLASIHSIFPGTPDHLLADAGEIYEIQKIVDYVFYEEATHRALDNHFFHIAQQITGKRFVHVF